jgi:hypothetical protein
MECASSHLWYVRAATNIPAYLTSRSQGWIHPKEYSTGSSTSSEVLPSISMSSITPSPAEVVTAFHLPLSYLTEHRRLRHLTLPHRPPHWAVDVTDLLKDRVDPKLWTGDEKKQGEVKIEVWGLTGWYLNLLMRYLDVY